MQIKKSLKEKIVLNNSKYKEVNHELKTKNL